MVLQNSFTKTCIFYGVYVMMNLCLRISHSELFRKIWTLEMWAKKSTKKRWILSLKL